MAELKTKANDASVTGFLDSIADEKKRADAYQIVDMMRKATRAEPKMWGSGIIGFGDAHYAYASGREGDWFLLGVAPRKQNFTLYALGNSWGALDEIKELGKYSVGTGCLYIKRLDDVNVPVLKKLVAKAAKIGMKMQKEMAKKKKAK